jgi:hypothetical protein
MIRSLLLALLAGLVLAPDARAQDTKYWVYFTDRPGSVSIADGPHVTDRARARRALRGVDLASGTDRDVHGPYVDHLEALGARPAVRSRWLNAVSARMDPATRDRVAALPFVRAVRPVGAMLPAADESSIPVWPIEWPLADPAGGLLLDYGLSFTQLQVTGFIGPLESGLNGAGVRLGLIDTGTGDLMHPATRHLVESGRILGQVDFSGQPADISTHARAVLSVAAGFDEGELIGPAWGADILLARSEYTPTETNQEEDAFVAAMEWMEAQGADVVNVSLGYTTFDAGEESYTYQDMDGDTAVTTVASDLAAERGVVVVAAAGNSACASPASCWYYIGSPADGDSVITAGGIRADSTRYPASSWGPASDGRTKPDVAAMGTGVYVPANSSLEYVYSGGTSFASPMVAAAAVLLLQVRPDLTPMEVRDLLRATASQSQNPDNSLGWGIINAEAALALATRVEDPELPRTIGIEAWPNPFADRLTLRMAAPEPGQPVRIELFDLLGRSVWRHEGPPAPDGTLEVDIDGRTLPSGLLVYRVRHGGAIVTGSLVHLR